MWNERSQSQKITNCLIPFIWHPCKYRTIMRENRSLVAGSYRWGYNVAIKRQHGAFFGGDGTILYPDCGVCMYGFIHVLKCIQGAIWEFLKLNIWSFLTASLNPTPPFLAVGSKDQIQSRRSDMCQTKYIHSQFCSCTTFFHKMWFLQKSEARPHSHSFPFNRTKAQRIWRLRSYFKYFKFMVANSFPQTKLYMGHRESGKLTRFSRTLQKARKLLSHEMTEELAVRGRGGSGHSEESFPGNPTFTGLTAPSFQTSLSCCLSFPR